MVEPDEELKEQELGLDIESWAIDGEQWHAPTKAVHC